MSHRNRRGGYTKYFPREVRIDHDPETGDTFRVAINGHGFRGPEFRQTKPAGVIRVVTLGASSTFGYYNRDNETYPHFLELEFNARCGGQRTFEVINLGILHTKAKQNVALFRREAVPLSPDVVTFYEGINDNTNFQKRPRRIRTTGSKGFACRKLPTPRCETASLLWRSPTTFLRAEADGWAIPTTTPWPRRSSGSSRPRSSGATARGATLKKLSSRPSNGSTGSITDDCSNRSDTFLRLSSKRCTMNDTERRPWRSDSTNGVSGKDGAVQADSAIAVVISLAYLAIQIRQNTKTVRASTYQAVLDSSRSDTELLLAHPPQGNLEGCVIACPLHDARFDVTDGSVVQRPAARPLTTYPVSDEVDGTIRIHLGVRI